MNDKKNKNQSKPCCDDKAVNTKSDAHSSHPVATGVGAASGGIVGAVGGSVAGPVGTVAGAAVGALVGGLAGSVTAEALDPTIEAAYWQENHDSQLYASPMFGYMHYAPAYRYGWESYGRHGGDGKTFDSVEAELGRGWDRAKQASHLGWDKAKLAAERAWHRVESAGHGKKKPEPAVSSKT